MPCNLDTRQRAETFGLRRLAGFWPVLLVTLVALALGAAAPRSAGGGGGGGAAEVIPFSAARIIIEVNDTDGDAGIRMFVDGEPWKRVNVLDPGGKKVLTINGSAGVKQQGVTELFFEDAEPSFDEQTLEELFELFPEGEYVFEGVTTEGDELAGTATLTHAVPGGPVVITPPEDGVDLHGCPSADTSQLAVLIAGERHAREMGARMQVAGLPQLRRLDEVCRVDGLLDWVSDSAPAVA